MFERFTDRARRVVVLAQEEARLLNHNYIGTEHILLGIVHEGEGVGAKALEVMRISLESVRREVEQIIGRGERVPSGHIPFTPRAKKVLELSLRESMQLGHNYIGTEHILLGLLREGEGVGAQALMKLGADLSQVRQAVIELLSGYSGQMEAQPESVAPRLVYSTGPGVRAEQTCSFCGRDLLEVDRYVAGIGAVICDACVAAATQAVATGSSREVNLPPRVFGEQPATTADTAAIARAFSTVFGTSETRDRPALLEDGEHIFEFLGTVQSQLPQVQVQRVVVSGIRLTGVDTAEVRFSIHIGPGMGGISRLGRAIRSGGTWQVSRETFAELVAMGGIRLPPRGTTRSPEEPPPPTP